MIGCLFGSTRTHVREGTRQISMRLILKGFQRVAGGRRQAHRR